MLKERAFFEELLGGFSLLFFTAQKYACDVKSRTRTGVCHGASLKATVSCQTHVVGELETGLGRTDVSQLRGW